MLLQEFQKNLEQCPLVAIIRGVKPDEVESIAEALLEGGVRIIEIPLNSPQPLNSLERLARVMEGRGLCGAGTVVTLEEAQSVRDAGGQLIVSPNCDTGIISATLEMGLVSLPGCLTPTEIFAAIGAGATYVKVFPGGDLGPDYLTSLHGPLPDHITTLAVGGIDTHNMADFWRAGARGFGLGSNLYHAGDNADQVREKALRMMEAVKQLPTG